MIEKANMKKLLLTTLFVLFNAQANAEIVEIKENGEVIARHIQHKLF